MTLPPEGLLLVDKPAGPTSHDVVVALRRLTRQRRVGHAGTLDPAATGLLPLALGRATRLIRFLPQEPKTYEGVLRLGITTSSDDETGEVIRRHEGPLPGPEAVSRAAGQLTGRLLQRPPMVSARKVGGKRLYRLARSGRAVSAAAAPVHVFRLDLSPGEDEGLWRFHAEVSAGTYVRSLARDLGELLGCGGCVARLRRTAIGPFRVEVALSIEFDAPPTPDELARAVLPLRDLPLIPPPLRLPDESQARRFRSGNPVPCPGLPGGTDRLRILDPRGELLGIGQARDDGKVYPLVVLPESS